MPDTNIPTAPPIDRRYCYDQLYTLITHCNHIAIQGNVLVNLFVTLESEYLSESERNSTYAAAQAIEDRYHIIADTLDDLQASDTADATLQRAFTQWDPAFTTIRISTNMLLQSLAWQMDPQSRHDLAENIVESSKQVAKAIPKLLTQLQA